MRLVSVVLAGARRRVPCSGERIWKLGNPCLSSEAITMRSSTKRDIVDMTVGMVP